MPGLQLLHFLFIITLWGTSPTLRGAAKGPRGCPRLPGWNIRTLDMALVGFHPEEGESGAGAARPSSPLLPSPPPPPPRGPAPHCPPPRGRGFASSSPSLERCSSAYAGLPSFNSLQRPKNLLSIHLVFNVMNENMKRRKEKKSFSVTDSTVIMMSMVCLLEYVSKRSYGLNYTPPPKICLSPNPQNLKT